MVYSLKTRPLTVEDSLAFKKLRLMALELEPNAFGASFNSEKEQSLTFFEKRCSQTETNVVFGHFADDLLVGIINLVRGQSKKVCHQANIYSVFTHPDFRCQGISTILLSTIIDYALDQEGLKWLQLAVNATNQAAIHLYQQAGFISWGIQQEALKVDDVYYDEQMMALNLTKLG